MPTFTGNLKTIGIDPRAGLMPELVFTIQGAGVNRANGITAGSVRVTPASDGSFSVTLETTVGMVPRRQVKLTGGWLGEDAFFELPPFDVPDVNGTISDLIQAVVGNDLVWSSPTAVDSGVYAGFQLNTSTGDLYERQD
jgi:hypothetical protein